MTKPGIGSSPRRREDQRLVTGAGTFGDDFTLPGQTFAAIARSPHAHAILQSIETTTARELPGVLAVLTAAEYLADGMKPLVHSPFTVSPPDITLANSNGKPVFVAPHYPLALDRVRFVGEGVVLVVAETLAAAREAAELVEVEYEVLAASSEGVDAAEPGAARIWPDMEFERRPRRGSRGCACRRAGLQAGGPRRSHRDKDTSRHRRSHGTQNRPCGPRAGFRQDHALCGRRRDPSPANGSLSHAGRGAGQDTRGRQGCRWQFRHAQQLLSRILAGGLGGAPSGTSRQMDGRSHGSVPQRLPRSRSGRIGRAGPGQLRQVPGVARVKSQQYRRLRDFLHPFDEGHGTHVKHLPRTGGVGAGACRVLQFFADGRLPQRRTAGGHVRNRAADRSCRANVRLRPAGSASHELHSPRRAALRQSVRHDLRQRPLRESLQ